MSLARCACFELFCTVLIIEQSQTLIRSRGWLQVDVLTPEDHMGDVIGDLNSRRGMVEGFTDRPGGMKMVNAQVRCCSDDARCSSTSNPLCVALHISVRIASVMRWLEQDVVLATCPSADD